MTSKDYVAIAACFRKARAETFGADILPASRAAYDRVSKEIADVLARDNPRFDRARFLTACGVGA